jgi:D-alanine-D-alanine ligase
MSGDRKARSGFGKVAVLMGGTSAEREVSLETGNAVHAALKRRKVNAHSIDARDAFLGRLVEEQFDRVFIALHGRRGEDGVIQGALETLDLPYTGSGVLGSALAMDKVRTKWVWQSRGIPTPDFIVLKGESDLDSVASRLGFPVMVKPVHEGSSCGASKVKRAGDLLQAWRAARALDSDVMAERWVEGAEYTASILGSRVLPLIRLETPREFYDYEAKYIADTTRYLCPCGLEPEAEGRIAGMARDGFEAVGATGWGRVDLIVDKAGLPWFIEVNTIPGMTSHSLVPMAARHAGIEFDDLVIRILETSMTGGEPA